MAIKKFVINVTVCIQVPDDYTHDELKALWRDLAESGGKMSCSDGSEFDIRTDKITFEELKKAASKAK